MDYKEKYTREEALREVRGFMGQLTEGCQAAIKALIPELAESEDERIRKEIVSIVQSYRDSCIIEGTHRFDDCLAWLEKQKHTAPNEYDEKMRKKIIDHLESIKMGCVICTIDTSEEIAWLEKQKEQNSPDSTGLYYYDGKKFTCCGFPYNFTMNQQEEQKTVAISENNNSDANGHLTGKILVEYGAHAKVRDGKRHCEMDWKEFQRLAHYFYELGKTEQKPVEWSEEDEKMLKCCLIAINHYEKTCNIGDHLPTKFNIDGYLASVDKVKSWLKSLRPQPKQEWSEEDKTMINHIIEALPKWANGLITILPSQAEEYVKRLKSLRPSWKPSEDEDSKNSK